MGHVELEDETVVEQREEGRRLDAQVEEHRHRLEFGVCGIENAEPTYTRYK